MSQSADLYSMLASRISGCFTPSKAAMLLFKLISKIAHIRRKYKMLNPEGIYFVSFATINWMDVFVRQQYFEIIDAEKGQSMWNYYFRNDICSCNSLVTQNPPWFFHHLLLTIYSITFGKVANLKSILKG